MTIVLDEFAYVHFDKPDYEGTKITNMNKADFMRHLNDYLSEKGGFDSVSVEGYAPFCRHIFLPNHTDAKVNAIKITDEITPLIRSGYIARRPEELPVLTRWIKASDVPGGIPKARYLDLIFYSREQLVLEAKAMSNVKLQSGNWDWGLISIKGLTEPRETPMQPITAMRNALGREYGGSSVPIDETKYRESVDYWSNYVSIQ